VALLTLLPTIFQPFALYKTFAEGLLLVVAFMFLPEGIFGWAAVRLRRLLRRKDAVPPVALAPGSGTP
jgi:branched-chain amino acid transport system permease protein